MISSAGTGISLHVSKVETISELRDAIRSKKAPGFDSFPADKLRLWKVKNLQNNDELEIGDYGPSCKISDVVLIIGVPEVSSTSKSDAEVYQLEALSLSYLRSQIFQQFGTMSIFQNIVHTYSTITTIKLYLASDSKHCSANGY
ncbi:hypothetical protein Glove_606g127 [Diversispora epigaea]|uniref:Crinkler effector protein N-terminal domain-containing protein n=1 Tax=Diversispora epigaea TaxID=1348612 RepID=A0A397GCW1_9GLOM|nr:hypothetical protein Glove_606g127 [Diversispora epigaea]